MEPITTVGAGLAILGSKDILNKILGPTADYIGTEAQGFVQKCNINLDNIFVSAKRKLGPRMEEPGQVNPRVLKHILDEGRFCEDDLLVEYYGGVLASSKTKNGRDDRGAVLAGTIKDLSAYQVRLHYLCYYLVNKLFKEKKVNIGTEFSHMKIYIPIEVFLAAMDFSEGEDPGGILIHSINGLVKHDLLGSDCRYGSKQFLSSVYEGAQSNGMVLEPSVHGAELFLWANGVKGASGHEISDGSFSVGAPDITVIEGAAPIHG